MSFYVYELWDPLKNEPFYVGKGKLGVSNPRHLSHLKDSFRKNEKGYIFNSHRNYRIRKIVQLGAEPISKIVFETEKESVAFEKEKELIKKYGRRDLKTGSLTNNTDGGDGVSGKICSETERLNKSISHRGEKNYMFGKNHTAETIKKIAEARRNRKTVFHHSEEWKKQLKKSSLILRTKEKSLPIYQIDLAGNVVKKWASANEATLALGFPTNSNIYPCAKYNHRIYKKHHWIYEKDAQIVNNKLTNIDDLIEKKKRLSANQSREIEQYTMDGVYLKTWASYSEADRILGLDYSILSNIIRGKRKSNIYWGFLWKSPKGGACVKKRKRKN